MTRARGEEALTARLAARARRETRAPGGARLRLGIGDDAAVVDLPRGRWVLTADTLVESVDFPRRELPFWIGRRAAAANLSDVAAMGAAPVGYLLSIAVRRRDGIRHARRIADGVLSKMGPAGAALWGGDLSRAAQTVVTIFLVGAARRPVARCGARPGDVIFVTGRPGAAAEALALRRRRAGRRPTAPELPYLDPEPRIAFSGAAAQRGWIHAMIDVSDGLARDAHRLADASRVRLVLSDVDPRALKTASDDFELLFAAPERRAEAIRALARRLRTPLSEIGRVERGRGVVLRRGGATVRVAPAGFDHFA